MAEAVAVAIEPVIVREIILTLTGYMRVGLHAKEQRLGQAVDCATCRSTFLSSQNLLHLDSHPRSRELTGQLSSNGRSPSFTASEDAAWLLILPVAVRNDIGNRLALSHAVGLWSLCYWEGSSTPNAEKEVGDW